MSDKTTKSWFRRHKIATVIIAFVAIGIIGNLLPKDQQSNTGSSAQSKSTVASTAKAYRFNDRADKQPTDVEVSIDEPATLDGVKMTAQAVNYTTSLDEYSTADAGKTYLVMNVTIENTSQKTQPYNVYDFRVQTAGGQVLDHSFQSQSNPLDSGDLVAGGKVTGQVAFELPVEAGHQYVIWKPNSAKPNRAIVQAK